MHGGGWYTRILAPVLKERGKLYVALGTKGIEESLLKQPGFEAVEVLPVVTSSTREGRRTGIGTIDFGVTGVVSIRSSVPSSRSLLTQPALM